jgi:hypothetical protein
MKWFPQEKQRIDFLDLATRKEKSPWMDRFYLTIGLLFFGFLFYSLVFSG